MRWSERLERRVLTFDEIPPSPQRRALPPAVAHLILVRSHAALAVYPVHVRIRDHVLG
jgi:hypothetical protein